MPHVIRTGRTLAVTLVAAMVCGPSVIGPQRASAAAPGQRDASDGKPSLSLRLNPPLGFSPLRVRAVAELRGGASDYAEFYCASIEWDWGDGTISENSSDCDPYEAGKSEIQRRFSTDHVYRQSGGYRASFRLKQKTRVVASSVVTVQVRQGAREGFE